MTDRRYSEEEIAAIFSDASEDPRVPPLQAPRDDGLTLVELQQIGREVGISPDAVARAARSLDVRPHAGLRRFLGLPIGVERTIALNRWLTDAEWERLVVRLREVFDARGAMSAHGNFRQWTNGNLQALLEPTATGHRLRLRTTKGSARAGMGAGLAALGMGGVVAIASAMGGHLAAATPGIMTMMLMGAGMVAYNALPLRNWARLRGRQMDAVATELALSEGEPAPEGGT
ncbi:MAG: hypothetical protein ACREOJ_19190 [Gemmatimonadaceae bacterium]